MKKLIYFTAVLLSLMMGLSGPAAMAAKGGNEKVGVCHVTKDANDPYVYISISENAVDAHLSHSDGMGHADYVSENSSEADCNSFPDEAPTNQADCEAIGWIWVEPFPLPDGGFSDPICVNPGGNG